jgi:hypothetical protein
MYYEPIILEVRLQNNRKANLPSEEVLNIYS